MKDSRLGLYECGGVDHAKGEQPACSWIRLHGSPQAPWTLYLHPWRRNNDDIVSVYFVNGEWRLQYMSPGTPAVATIREVQSRPLSKEAITQVLDEMCEHASAVL